MHPDERASIERRKEGYAKRNGLAVAQAEQELLTQANLMVQNGSPGQWNERAAQFLREERGMLSAEGNSGPKYMFYTTLDQRANSNMYAGYYANGTGMNQPDAGNIANSVNRDNAYHDAYTRMTWGAAAGAAGIAVLGPVAALPGAPILSSGGALGSSTWASPVGTGAISAGINAGAQYVQNGTINPVDVVGAFATGMAGTYNGAGLMWNVGVNTVGGATTTALNNILQGKNDSIEGSASTSGVLSSLGYGIGKLGESGVNSALKPSINTPNWASTGLWSSSGWNLFRSNTFLVVQVIVVLAMATDAVLIAAEVPTLQWVSTTTDAAVNIFYFTVGYILLARRLNRCTKLVWRIALGVFVLNAGVAALAIAAQPNVFQVSICIFAIAGAISVWRGRRVVRKADFDVWGDRAAH